MVFKAYRKPLLPDQWELTDLVVVPPSAVDPLLALQPVALFEAEPALFSQEFQVFIDGLAEALQRGDSSFVVSHLMTASYICPATPEPLVGVPSCLGQPSGTPVEVVPWDVYCTACDANGLATSGELEAWLERLLSSSMGYPSDALGPSSWALESVSARPPDDGYAVTVSGIGETDLFGYPRRPGRWVITFHVEDYGGGLWIVRFRVADPDAGTWMLPTLRGTNVVWTRWAPID